MLWNNLELPDGAYHVEEDVVIYNADCREILPLLPKVDLVLTDPPYGNNTDYQSYDDTSNNLRDLIKYTLPIVLDNARVTLITCGVSNIHKYPEPDWILSWINKAGSGSGPWGFCCWQPILAYGKDPYLVNCAGRRPDLIDKNETSDSTIKHPCPKPVDLWQLVMLRGSYKDTDLILDPFLGSGTTAVAAKKLGRKCIGIEIEEKYCKIAVERLRQSVMKLEA